MTSRRNGTSVAAVVLDLAIQCAQNRVGKLLLGHSGQGEFPSSVYRPSVS